ncbi:MAG: divergent polysaccharide deacetylase family protein [Gammaproteobacteria bacterium]
MIQLTRALILLLFGSGAFATDQGVIDRTIPQPSTGPANAPPAQTGKHPQTRLPWVAIVIDDMGNNETDRQAVLLPGPIAYAFLPHTPYAVELALLAARNGKEVLLHQPMQSSADNNPGPGALLLEMDQRTFRDTFSKNLAALPYVSGINNHMGSLLTRHQQPMQWLMAELQRYPSLFFLDSRTTAQTVAYQNAEDHHIPSSSRDVFLDNQLHPEALLAQFQQLITIARKQGSAIAIGHPYPQTIAFLREHLPDLKRAGIDLRAVSDIIDLRQPALRTAWQRSAPAASNHQQN